VRKGQLMAGFDRAGLKGVYLCALTESEVEQVHDGALQTLAKTGIIIRDDVILALLDEAGCQVSRRRWDYHVRIPADVVENAVAKAPPTVTLSDRFGEPAMVLGAGPLHARSSSGATRILDLESARRREPTRQDAADAARVADALPHILGVSTMAVQPADVPAATVDLHAVRITLANTVKPLGYVCLNARLIQPALAMFAAVAGGEEALRRRPIVSALAESTSPLQLVPSQLAVLRAFASRGLPLTLHAHPMAGFTAPVTLAGELVITHAEILSLVAIAQLLRPGTPVVYGMSSSVPDMRSGTNLAGAVEIGLLGVATAQLARRCGLPCVMSSGTDARQPGTQAVMERLMTLLPPALAGADLVNLSTLESKMAFSLEQLVLDDAVLSVVERYLRGIGVDPETIGLDLIDEVGPRGAFVSTDHTVRHFREELLDLDLVRDHPLGPRQDTGGSSMQARARDDVRRILAEHRPVPLADGIAAQLDEIIEEAETQVHPLLVR